MSIEYKKSADEAALDQEILKSLMGSDSDLKSSQNLFNTQNTAEIIRTYLDETVPDNIKKSNIYQHMWAVVGNTLKLSFFDDKSIFEFEALFNIAKYDYIMSIPAYEYDFETAKILSQLRIYYLSAIRRAIGGAHNKINERVLLSNSTQQVIKSSTEINQSGKQKKGFMGWF